MTAETIEIIPTWRGIMPLLVELAANADSAAARKNSMDQLLKLAEVVDALNEEAKKKKNEPEEDPHKGYITEDAAFDAMYVLLGAERARLAMTDPEWVDQWETVGHTGMAARCMDAAKLAGETLEQWVMQGNYFESVYAYDVAEPLGEWLAKTGPIDDAAVKAEALRLIQKA